MSRVLKVLVLNCVLVSIFQFLVLVIGIWRGGVNISMYRASDLELIFAMPEEKIFVTERAVGA